MKHLGNGNIYVVASSSNPNTAYLVAYLYDSRQWCCSCPAGLHGVACHHIGKVQAQHHMAQAH